MTSQQKVYQQNITQGKEQILNLKRKLYGISFLRLIFFVLTFVSPFIWHETSVALAVSFAIIFFALFLFFVKRYLKLSQRKKFEQFKVEINEKELLALEHRFDQFDDGREFIDPNHMNAYDLDLFGKGSMFQFLNRTVMAKGKEQLANMLQNPILESTQITERQQLIQELTEPLEWRQNFLANGLLYGNNTGEEDLFEKWSTQEFSLKSERLLPALLWILPIMSIAAVLYWIFMGQSGWFIIASTIQFAFWGFEGKRIAKIYAQFGKREQILRKYEVLLRQIETFPWQSKEGQERVQHLIKEGKPSEEARQLRRIIASFDNRINLLLGIVVNLLFSWDILHSYKLIKWHRHNKANYSLWMNAIAFADACNSLANYAYNHDRYSYPEFETGNFELTAQQMGHPLIHPDKRVDNDFRITGSQRTIIITGANMSGKSTFLRTIGVNLVLGMAGAPVCARMLKFKPVVVFSNMRTTDSLFDDESYFFAELKRLQMILQEVEKGHELLIILDEILKGTNSVDKLHGSQKLVKRLIDNGTPAVIATHDLKLTEIEENFPDKVKNECFEITIENDEMQFDYTLRNGVTTIMNASFLMKKMGIIK